MTLDKILETLMEIGIKVGGKIVIALLILVIGSLISKKLVKLLDNAAAKAGTDDTVRIFGMNALRIILKVVILISIISVFLSWRARNSRLSTSSFMLSVSCAMALMPSFSTSGSLLPQRDNMLAYP